MYALLFLDWHCKSCTMVNAANSILCEVCERPRLATRPPATPSHKPANPPRPPAPVLGMPGDPDSQVSYFSVCVSEFGGFGVVWEHRVLKRIPMVCIASQLTAERLEAHFKHNIIISLSIRVRIHFCIFKQRWKLCAGEKKHHSPWAPWSRYQIIKCSHMMNWWNMNSLWWTGNSSGGGPNICPLCTIPVTSKGIKWKKRSTALKWQKAKFIF